MNTLEKLEILGGAAKYDACAATSKNKKGQSGPGICHASTPDGRCISLLKVLFTNVCKHDCAYCANTACQKRAEFEPHELAELTQKLYIRNYVEGLFLSSGVSGDETRSMEKIIECAKILRTELKFEGYLHLKLLPGASREHIHQLAELADRVSINMEAPTKSHFCEVTSTKDYTIDVIRRLRWLSKENVASGASTQFVVGATTETDSEIITATNKLYKKLELKRTYYSAFSPVKGTALAHGVKTPLKREHRLYQTDWLLRIYNFSLSEVKEAFDENGFLPLGIDPKFTLAKNMEPVNPKTAEFEELIRVPGIGPRLAKKIICNRADKLLDERNLKKLGVSKKALPFLDLGHRQVRL